MGNFVHSFTHLMPTHWTRFELYSIQFVEWTVNECECSASSITSLFSIKQTFTQPMPAMHSIKRTSCVSDIRKDESYVEIGTQNYCSGSAWIIDFFCVNMHKILFEFHSHRRFHPIYDIPHDYYLLFFIAVSKHAYFQFDHKYKFQINWATKYFELVQN